MANKILDVKIKQATKTAAQWASQNPILLNGEVGHESDSTKTKTGNGSTTWNSLPYDKADKAYSADKLTAARSISLGTALSSTPTNFDGSGNITIPITGVSEAYLNWGGRNISGGYAPIDAAMVPVLGANRLAFTAPSAISIEYSRDGGVTWVDYGASDAIKINLLNGNTAGIQVGGGGYAAGTNYTNYQVRLTINTSGQIYTALNKFVLYISTSGSTGAWCTIDARLQSNFTGNIDTWAVFANQVPISGYSGYNVINTNNLTTYGNTPTSQYGQVRFTFGQTGYNTTSTATGLKVQKILGFGGVGWTTPSTLAGTGLLYTYDYEKNTVFPARISGTQLISRIATGTSPLSVTSTTRVPNLNADMLDGKHADSFSLTSHNHTKANITDFPTLATVATTGSYNDLSNKPTIPTAYSLPTASASVLGGIKVGSNLSISSGVLSATDTKYTLPTATTATLGGVIASTGLSVGSPGDLSVKYGTTSGTACQGNDSRLSNARTPTAHTHLYAGSSSAGGSANSAVYATKVTTPASTVSQMYLLGSSANTAVTSDALLKSPVYIDGAGNFRGANSLEENGSVLSEKYAKKPSGVHFVIGTHTSTTASWTGIAPDISELYDGLTIKYWTPYSSNSSTTLNLTLSGGGTTGAINCYYSGTSRLTSHYPAGNIVTFTYRKNANINGTSTYTGWWVNADYNVNTFDRTYWGNTITAGATIYSRKLLMQGIDGKFYPLTLESGTGTTKTVSTQEFKINSQILFYAATTTVALNGTATNVYSEYPLTLLNYTANQASWTSQKLIYLKGKIASGTGNFKLDNTTVTSFMTQTLPNSADGFVYVLLGYMYATTGMRLFQYHPMYEYRDGAVRPYIPIHSHGNLTNDGKIGTTAKLPIITGTGGILQAGSFGTAAGTFCQGNDSRLSNARTPTAHTHGNLTNDGKIGTTANRLVKTTTGGALSTVAAGSAGQFLAHDLTWATPASGGATFPSLKFDLIAGNFVWNSSSYHYTYTIPLGNYYSRVRYEWVFTSLNHSAQIGGTFTTGKILSSGTIQVFPNIQTIQSYGKTGTTVAAGADNAPYGTMSTAQVMPNTGICIGGTNTNITDNTFSSIMLRIQGPASANQALGSAAGTLYVYPF